MSSQPRNINLDDDIDRLRYRCPRGHANWEATNHHFWCTTCARSWEFDGAFTELRDATNGDLLGRDEVMLDTNAGAYDDLFENGAGD